VVPAFGSANPDVQPLLVGALDNVQRAIDRGETGLIPDSGWRYLGRNAISMAVYSMDLYKITYEILHAAIDSLIRWMRRRGIFGSVYPIRFCPHSRNLLTPSHALRFYYFLAGTQTSFCLSRGSILTFELIAGVARSLCGMDRIWLGTGGSALKVGRFLEICGGEKLVIGIFSRRSWTKISNNIMESNGGFFIRRKIEKKKIWWG